jgi:hypothetical protein
MGIGEGEGETWMVCMDGWISWEYEEKERGS